VELTVPRGLSLAAAAIKQKGTHREEQDRQSVSMDIGFFLQRIYFLLTLSERGCIILPIYLYRRIVDDEYSSYCVGLGRNIAP